MVLNVAATTAFGKIDRVLNSAISDAVGHDVIHLPKIDIEIHQIQNDMRPQAKIDTAADGPSHARILIASAKVFGARHHHKPVVIIKREIDVCVDIEIRLTDGQAAGNKAHQARRKHIAQPRSHRGVPVQGGLCGRANCSSGGVVPRVCKIQNSLGAVRLQVAAGKVCFQAEYKRPALEVSAEMNAARATPVVIAAVPDDVTETKVRAFAELPLTNRVIVGRLE